MAGEFAFAAHSRRTDLATPVAKPPDAPMRPAGANARVCSSVYYWPSAEQLPAMKSATGHPTGEDRAQSSASTASHRKPRMFDRALAIVHLPLAKLPLTAETIEAFDLPSFVSPAACLGHTITEFRVSPRPLSRQARDFLPAITMTLITNHGTDQISQFDVKVAT